MSYQIPAWLAWPVVSYQPDMVLSYRILAWLAWAVVSYRPDMVLSYQILAWQAWAVVSYRPDMVLSYQIPAWIQWVASAELCLVQYVFCPNWHICVSNFTKSQRDYMLNTEQVH